MSVSLAPAATAPAWLRRTLGQGPALRERARRRAVRLASLARDDVLAPDGIEDGPAGDVVARVPIVEGMDLTQVAAHRPPLTAPEVRWLGRSVADALAAMHAAGLVHGDVSPANVLVRAGGITLVDTLAAVRDDERGTPGFRAPERVAGAHTERADVYALGRLMRWAVRAEDETEVRRLTAALVVANAAARPTAIQVSALIARAGPAVPVAVPTRDVAAAVRSRAVERTERIREGRWWRARRFAARATVVAAAVAAACWLTIAVPPLLDGVVETASAGTADSATVTEPGAPSDPAIAAVDLTERRVAALAASDGAALRATVAGDGAVVDDVESTAALLAAGTLAYEGLTVDVAEATLVSRTDASATVDLTYTLSAHRRRDATATQAVAARDESVRIDLAWNGDAWRVVAARAP
ncbi:RIO1 family regulatory kinase/ATPase [Demequina sp. NBRC 110055]|uniref:protein kinase domain-containing protein n=1 Tax=Demequina sp. NBRC 110055 TaxID=1570344 RepID=UPI000A03349A|nr:RIO1 family regulatory kinase/ATPase [Demequina sp. NBRC 110055]